MIDRTRIPAELPSQTKAEWREFILESVNMTEAGLRTAIARARKLKEKSIRSPLSRFLNGDGHEICLWLKPNENGRELTRLLPQSVPADYLANRLMAMLPGSSQTGLRLEDLNHIPLSAHSSKLGDTNAPAAEWLQENAKELPREIFRGGEVSWDELTAALSTISQGLLNRPDAPSIRLRVRTHRNLLEVHAPPNELAQTLGQRRFDDFIRKHPIFGEDVQATGSAPGTTVRDRAAISAADALTPRTVDRPPVSERLCGGS